MERLTKLSQRRDRYVSAIGSGQGCWSRIISRLAAYEDTGLEPEAVEIMRETKADAQFMLTELCRFCDYDQLEELAKADEDGRLVVLPCKVGDTVWANISVQGDRYRKADRPYPVKVVFLGMGEKSAYFHVEYDNGRVFPFDFDQFGKSVFLTREEAEAALKGGEW